MAVKVWIWACTPFCLQYRHYMGIYDVVIFADDTRSLLLLTRSVPRSVLVSTSQCNLPALRGPSAALVATAPGTH